MRSYRYVKLNPTGNLTCLVLDRTSPEDEKILTRELLKECEQVAGVIRDIPVNNNNIGEEANVIISVFGILFCISC